MGKKQEIVFYLNDRLMELDVQAQDARTTVVQFLRGEMHRTGTRKYCERGDCGACTVVVAEPDAGGRMTYRAVNACLLFLPMLHGKQLITIEGLRLPSGELHPIQQAFVEERGAQCGFCTPGMILSLFALFHQKPGRASREAIELALAGNICRCTGYQSILASALSVEGFADPFTEAEPVRSAQLMALRKDRQPLVIEQTDFTYIKVYTMADLLDFRAWHPEALLVSGATDVAVLRQKEMKQPAVWIDLSDVDELRTDVPGAKNRIGAGCRVEQLRLLWQETIPSFSVFLSHFGSMQIRNQASVAGSIGSSSPIGDLMPLFLALDADLYLRSSTGSRRVKAAEFNTGYKRNQLQPGEIIEAVGYATPSPDALLYAWKVARRKDLDISTVGFAGYVQPEDGVIKEVRLAFGGMAAVPARAVRTECFLQGKPFTEATFKEAREVLLTEFTPLSDVRASAAYRQTVAANLLIKFYHEITRSHE